MMKSDEKYQVPAWMRPLLPLLCNTGGNDPEELLMSTPRLLAVFRHF
ncbi:hypothetical protein [Escherichia coli]|nr:hypothetical protein [Escherichia coli]